MPFYTFGGSLSLQSAGEPVSGVSTLNLVNGLLEVDGSVANFSAPGVVVKGSGLTITDPVSLTFSGSAVVTQQATPPTIAQQGVVQLNYRTNIPATLPNPPTAGNLIILFVFGHNAYGTTPSGIWTGPIFSQINNNAELFCYYKTCQGASDQNVYAATGGSCSAMLLEIEQGGAIGEASGNAASVSGAYTFPAATLTQDTLALLISQGNNSTTVSNALPAGSEIITQGNDSNDFAYYVLACTVSSTETDFVAGVTYSGVEEQIVYGQVFIAPNPASVSATVTT